MDEDAIRPSDLMEKQKIYIQQDIEFLLKHKNNFVDVVCPACETANDVVELEKKGFSYLECSCCGMLYMSPRPDAEILSQFYPHSPNYKFFKEHIFPASCEMRREKLFIPRVEKVIEICEKNKIIPDKILEIGAGFGLFCEEMSKRRYFKEVVGVEASDSLYETCKERAFKVYNGILENLKIDEKFSFAVAYEVLEHIYNPYNFLKIVNQLLLPASMLMLTFPNYNGFDIGMLREHSSAIDHEHLNYFNEQSIAIILSRAGFELIEVQTPGQLDVELVKKAFTAGSIKNSFIALLNSDKYKAVRENLQKFLAENKLSSHMSIMARKI